MVFTTGYVFVHHWSRVCSPLVTCLFTSVVGECAVATLAVDELDPGVDRALVQVGDGTAAVAGRVVAVDEVEVRLERTRHWSRHHWQNIS